MSDKKIGGGLMSEDCGEIIFIPKCNICKKRPFSDCVYYKDSEKHKRYRGVVNCRYFEEDKSSLYYKKYKEMKIKNK